MKAGAGTANRGKNRGMRFSLPFPFAVFLCLGGPLRAAETPRVDFRMHFDSSIDTSCAGRLGDAAQSTRDLLDAFLTRNNAFTLNPLDHSATDAEFENVGFFLGPTPWFHPPSLNETNLASGTDTFVFSLVVGKVLARMELKNAHLFDLGAGTSLSTIGAIARGTDLLRTLHERDRDALTVHAVDLDSNALLQGRAFLCLLNGIGHPIFQFENSDILGELPRLVGRKNVAVVSNPPYVPIPSDLKDARFLAVDGGENGIKFLQPILTTPYAKGTLVGVLTSSLSDPRSILETIDARFEVEAVSVLRVKFGSYTSSPRVLSYLQSLREKGVVLFQDGYETGGNSYLLIGLVLRAR